MKKNYNYIFAIVVFLLFFFLFKYDILSSSAICIFSYWVSSIFIRGNDCLPLKELFLSLYGLQFLFSPALTYHVLESFTVESYLMKISSDDYFKFTIPVFLSFSLGLNVFVKAYDLKLDIYRINEWVEKNPNSPYYFLAIGFLSPFLNYLIPSSLYFLSYLLSGFKFTGVFILIMSYKKLKPVLIFSVFFLMIVNSFIGGLFHDLLIWLLITFLFVGIRFKPNWRMKLISVTFFVVFVIFIQSIKGGLRQATWYGQEDISVDLIQNVNAENIESKDGFFSINNIGPQFMRFNQGWILASTIDNVPKYANHTYGKLTIEYLYSAILPRIIASSKLESGNTNNFVLYSNHDVIGSTMALGLFTDAYIEFGKYGAILYVFLFGLFYGYIMKQLFIRSRKYPVLILFIGLVFLYALRPDCETNTALGHLFKMIFLLTLIFTLFRKTFQLPPKKIFT